jgi:GT2 family glycosyltransferase
VLDEIGGFDERFFMYMEDVELSLRARLAGWDVVFAPRSRVVHDYTLDIPAWKFYYLERNRLLMLMKIFRWRTLLAMAPALAAAEAGVIWYALRAGRPTLSAKLRSYAGVARELPALLRGRARAQRIRRVGDRALLATLDSALPHAPGAPGATLMRAADAFFSGYARMLRRIVRW